MAFNSKNMNYIFNIEYFEGIENTLLEENVSKDIDDKVKERNKAIENFTFAGSKGRVAELEGAFYERRFSYRSFRLYTQYPGLLTGIGYPHNTKRKGAVKCGFLFDYVTGLPYIPGSTVKGMLRSYFKLDAEESEMAFEYEAYIKGLLNKKEPFDLQGLKDNIFEYNDTFLDAYPDIKECKDGILKMEYITPHEKNKDKDPYYKFKDPEPISMLKVKPNVPFTFRFLLTDYIKDEKPVLSAQEKSDLFKKLILDMGIGAKTNVGFGRLAERKAAKNNNIIEKAEQLV